MNTQTIDSVVAPELVVSNLPLPAVTRRLQGKIPSLPKAQRDTINHPLLDGATYAVEVGDREVGHRTVEKARSWQLFRATGDYLGWQR